MTRPALLIILAALLLLSACGAWEDGAGTPPATPAGYIWIPGEVGTPEPWPTVKLMTPTPPPNVTATDIP